MQTSKLINKTISAAFATTMVASAPESNAIFFFFFNSRMKYSYTTKKYKVILDIFYFTHVSYIEFS